jgi:hypothetical protein
MSSAKRKNKKKGFGGTFSSPLRTRSPQREQRGFSPFSKIGSPLQGDKRSSEEVWGGGRGRGGGVTVRGMSLVLCGSVTLERDTERERERERRDIDTQSF